MISNGTIIIWLLLLSLSTIGSFIGITVLWMGQRRGDPRVQELSNAIKQVRIAETLQDVVSALNAHTLATNRELRHRVEILLKSIEGDPMMHERYYTQVTALKQLL